MENLEDVAFDRFCRYLKNWKIDFILGEYGYYYVYIDGNRVPIYRWRSKKNILIDFDLTLLSFFHVCKLLNRAVDALYPYEIYLANMYEKLKMIEADSYEEMLIKMDLAGI